MKILYVEDNGPMRRSICRKIEQAGYEVSLASDGFEALAALEEKLPDLVLCDDIMPNMTGTELLAEIRNNHSALDEIPFVLLSGRSKRSQLLKGLELGADDYLVKPVDLELMLAKIKSMTRLKSRFEKVKNLEKENIYKALQAQSHPEEQFGTLLDNLLERLEHEYDECVKLKETALELKAELFAEKEKNKELITRLEEMENTVDVSLSCLLDIREKINETKHILVDETISSENLWVQLEDIGQKVEATIIPVSRINRFQYR